MKILRCMLLAVIVGSLAAGPCLGADTVPTRGATAPVSESEPQKRFDLDFKGGLPQQLVEAVEKATKVPLNVIIPEEHRDFVLPHLKMRNVTVLELFSALGAASAKSETRLIGGNYTTVNTSYGFRTSDQRANVNSIWYFYVNEPSPVPPRPAPAPQCRFWQLEPHLEKLKVEDITTAIETGWKMQGVNPLPKLSFHKDTKLLIVVGQYDQLTTVDDVLRELTPGTKERRLNPSRSASPAPSQ